MILSTWMMMPLKWRFCLVIYKKILHGEQFVRLNCLCENNFTDYFTANCPWIHAKKCLQLILHAHFQQG